MDQRAHGARITTLLSQMDDVVYALVRTQRVISHTGDVLTGGIVEAVFDIKINKILNPKARIVNFGARFSLLSQR